MSICEYWKFGTASLVAGRQPLGWRDLLRNFVAKHVQPGPQPSFPPTLRRRVTGVKTKWGQRSVEEITVIGATIVDQVVKAWRRWEAEPGCVESALSHFNSLQQILDLVFISSHFNISPVVSRFLVAAFVMTCLYRGYRPHQISGTTLRALEFGSIPWGPKVSACPWGILCRVHPWQWHLALSSVMTGSHRGCNKNQWIITAVTCLKLTGMIRVFPKGYLMNKYIGGPVVRVVWCPISPIWFLVAAIWKVDRTHILGRFTFILIREKYLLGLLLRTQSILGHYLPNLNVACFCTSCPQINVADMYVSISFCWDVCQKIGD